MSTASRILIVDDHEAIRRGVRNLLSQRADMQVCGEAGDGLDAVEKARELRPDLVLMDISMPRMDGIEASRIIRSEFPDCGIVLVSQEDPQLLQRQARELGASGYVSKSGLAKDMLPALERIVAERNGDKQDMRSLIFAKDWSQTPLGPMEKWPPALRVMVNVLLANRFPLLLWWGPQYISIYNDAYIPVLGKKHRWALGQPVSVCWDEIWHVLQPLIDAPFRGGPPTWIEDFALEINRSGFVEETHFTVAYSPVPDETAPRGIGGVLATVHEITEKIVAERRVGILRDLGARATEGRTAEEACQVALETVAQHPKDIPFALIYLFDGDRRTLRLAGAAGIGEAPLVAPVVLDVDAEKESTAWPVSEAVSLEQLITVEDLKSRFGVLGVGPWSEPPNNAVIVPIRSNKPYEPAGVIICGVSSRLALDELYRAFFDLTAAQIATAVANARAYEEERKRAEALAEIDRAKTQFFSNVSHEFRTPLTLMLGPIEDLLSKPGAVQEQHRGQLEVAHRNSLRLLKLVNALLDFSRIEAGRVAPKFQDTDLSAFTAELASGFRSAMEGAGLNYVVDCPPLPQPVSIDRDMWEKIVLNLLSNSFKYTPSGEVHISLRAENGEAVLAVRDTGSGIPTWELPNIFKRFHRVEHACGRSHEGTGIGLALAQELVKLHDGAIGVESKLGVGTTFRVRIPTAPRATVGTAAQSQEINTSRGKAFVEEALTWLPREAAPENKPDITPTAGAAPRARVLLAEDNADMREYLCRLLRPSYEVEPVANGALALTAAQKNAPDLVLSDVMMPVMDGLQLVQALRNDGALSGTPLILLSARAGEEARVEGMSGGPDDYLVKPFSARELLARVATHLELARLRKQSVEALRESEQRLRVLADSLEQEVQLRTDQLLARNEEAVKQSELLRALSVSLLQTQDNERRNLARELHDSAGQLLAALAMNVGLMAQQLKQDSPLLSHVAEKSEELVQQLDREIRTTSYLLHPPLLDENGLPETLGWYIRGLNERSGLDVVLNVSEDFGRLSSETELAIFRVVQESLANVHRHSGVRKAAVHMTRERDHLLVEVQDEGRGIPSERLAEIQTQGAGVGIQGMRERVRFLGGQMVIESNGRGTKVRARFPVSAAGTQPFEVSAQ